MAAKTPTQFKAPKNNHPLDQPKIQQKFLNFRKFLSESMIERDEEVDIVLTAMLCGENPLLVGPPGTGKSMLLDTTMQWIDAPKFDVVFNKFTTPEEVFGPISLKGLENDEYRRVGTDMIQEAYGAFLDEIFKASSAILNTLLKILNEKTYRREKVPLIFAVAASNEHPNDMEGGKELGALYDRFLFRKNVSYISTPEGRSKLLWTFQEPVINEHASPQEIKIAQQQKTRIGFSNDAVEAFADILEDLQKEGIQPGDRRQRKAVDACRAFAYLCGEKPDEGEVRKEHLNILSHILWTDPTEQPQKCAKIVSRIANPIGSKVIDVIAQAKEIVQKNSAQESIDKLKELAHTLNEIEQYTKHPKIADAKNWMARQIKHQLYKVSGLKESASV